VSMAIARIGLKECQHIVSTIANKSLYETKNRQFKKLMDKLWEHSLACAYGARIISKKVSPQDEEKAFLSGLIHDIGSVLLLKSLGEIVPPKTTFDETYLINSVYEVHTSFGAYLLEKWEFTQDFVRIAKLHEWTKFDPKTEKDVLIANLADNLAHKIGYGFFDKGEIDLAGLDSTKLLQIDTVALDEIGEEVKTMMAESTGAF
ncbi:MAG TPA: HDOD domain-containing protein, partial [bacterium]|nr:HDOD domain-containing protein [bacterium]